jgi:isopenicillin N synthase-like dioxygenase
MERIPIVDLSPARTGDLRARQAVAKRIDDICREIGFFTIIGHGVPPEVMDALRSHAHTFCALPLDEKRKAIHPVANTPRGYRALGIEALGRANAGASPPDLKEFYHIGREAWPDEPYYSY